MNKALYLVLSILIIGSWLFAGDFIIGTGTSTQNYVPMYGYVNYNWSKFMYTAAEMQAAGFTTTQSITRIAFQLGGGVWENYVTDDQRVYMRAFYDAEYASSATSYPGTAGFFHVFSGTVSWNGPGWTEITLDTPYSYNPAWGLEILWENRDGSRIAGPPKFRYTSTSNYSAVRHNGSSTSFPTTSGTRSRENRPNIWFVTPTTEPPTPAEALNPLDAASGIPITTSLRWYQTGGSPTSYRLWLGTNNPPSDIVSALLLSTNQYTPQNYLEYGTTYYWRVVPINENGPATDCPVWSFSTMADPSITTFPYEESFDGAFPPTAWENLRGNLSDPIIFNVPGSTNWNQDDWLNIPGTDKAARFNLWGPLEGYLISPMFNVPSDDYAFEIDVALLKAGQDPSGTPPALNGDDDRFAILIGNGHTWSTANIVGEWNNAGSENVLNGISISGERIRIPLTGHTGRIRIAIYAGSTVLNADNDFMINNFWLGIPLAGLDTPILNITKTSLGDQVLLSWDAIAGATLYRVFKATDPYGEFLPFSSTSDTSLTLDALDSQAYFKIRAEN